MTDILLFVIAPAALVFTVLGLLLLKEKLTPYPNLTEYSQLEVDPWYQDSVENDYAAQRQIEQINAMAADRIARAIDEHVQNETRALLHREDTVNRIRALRTGQDYGA